MATLNELQTEYNSSDLNLEEQTKSICAAEFLYNNYTVIHGVSISVG